MANFLEQLVAEWYEFNGYFIRRNVHVGKRERGGYECELDVVAFNQEERRLLHIEPSMDADSWEKREARFRKKFEAGKKHIPDLFHSFKPLPEIQHIALLAATGASSVRHPQLGGGKVVTIANFLDDIRADVAKRPILKAAIPEQYVILRTLQFAAQHWRTARRAD